MQPHIVGIRFKKTGKIYHFDASKQPDIQVGDFAVVETSRGHQLGVVVQILKDPKPPPKGKWKPIHRKATSRDLVLRQIWQKKEIEAVAKCRTKMADMGIQGVKIVAAEFSFDGSRLTFLYNTEAEGKVDLSNLRKAIRRTYPRSRIEMRQIGPRDVAKLLGGMGACGLETRCCSTFLCEFSPISIRMAKEQSISLTPSEITGMCGRLRCCLIYEYEQYVQARKSLPKRNKRVITPMGVGKVSQINALNETVTVLLETGVRQEFGKEEIEPWEEVQALQKKAKEPCPKHPDGGCDCEEKPAPTPPSSKSTKGNKPYRGRRKKKK